MKINYSVVDCGNHPTQRMVLEQHISTDEDKQPSWSKFVCYAADETVGDVICDALRAHCPAGIWVEANEKGEEVE